MDFIYGETILYDSANSYKYLNSMYHSVMLFGVNEMASRTTFELAISSLIMLFSAMVNANIFGAMAVMVQQMNKKTVEFQEKIDISNTAMKNMKLPAFLQRAVSDYLLQTQNTQDQQKELQEFLEHLSPSLKFKVNVHIFNDVLRNNYIFKDLLEHHDGEIVINFIVKKLKIRLTAPESVLIE